MKTKNNWVFVIDTDQYSGNFDRELSAYVCGQWSEEEYHGEYEAEQFLKECGQEKRDEFESILQMKVTCDDDVPVNSFHCLWETEGMFNNGLGGIFKKGQEKEAVNHYNNSSQKRNFKPITVKTLNKSIAYQSIGIFFHTKPTKDQLKFLVKRAVKFSKRPKKNEWDKIVKITGCRLINEKTTYTEKICL